MHKTNKFIFIATGAMFFIVGAIWIVTHEGQDPKSWFMGNQSLDSILGKKAIEPVVPVAAPEQTNEAAQNQGNNLAQQQMNPAENQLPIVTTSEVKSEAEKTPAVLTEGKITLTGKKTTTGAKLSWEISKDLTAPNGFKIVKAKRKNPSYPGDDNKYINQESTRSYAWAITDGKEYHFRVCSYDGAGKCLVYSNDVSVKVPDKSSEDYATSVTLTGKKEGDDVKLSWTIVGGNAPSGFKVVMSKEKNPEYPTRSGDYYHYLSASETRSDTWKKDDAMKKLETGNTYYFRVCVYKGGTCGAYSSDVSVSY